DAPFIGAINMSSAKERVAAALDTAFGDSDVVPAGSLVELGALGHRSAVDFDSIVEQFGAIRGHLVKNDAPCADASPNEVGVAIVVPEGTWIFPSGDFFHRHAVRPRTGGVCGCPAK